jgi:hypothetical protein
VAVFIHTFGSAASPQAPAVAQKTATSTIRGRVIASDTGLGVRGARVVLTGTTPNERLAGTILSGTSIESRAGTTDSEGRFQIDGVSPGRYEVAASRPGYVTTAYGQRRAGDIGRSLVIAKPQVIEGVDVTIQVGGMLTTRVTDDLGEPIAGMSVNLTRVTDFRTERFMTPGLLGIRTNDKGTVRLTGIPPGAYYVSATPLPSYRSLNVASNKSGRTFTQTYYPGTPAVASALPVTVSAGQEQSVSFPLAVVRVATITGSIRMSDGQPATAGSIRLGATMAVDLSNPVLPMGLQPSGSFALFDVPPGDHVLTVAANPPGSRGTDFPGIEYARVPIVVAGTDISGLIITTSKGSTISGRIVWDDGPPPSIPMGTLRLGAVYSSEAIVSGGVFTPQPAWAFELSGVIGKGMLRISNPGNYGWYTKAVIIDGEDVTDTPVDFDQRSRFENVQVILTRTPAEVQGSVTDARNDVISNCVVVVFPEKTELWTRNSRFIGIGRPDQNGRFRIGGLPGGRYLAAALEFLDEGDERSPDVLKRLVPLATRISVADGQAASITLRIVQPR